MSLYKSLKGRAAAKSLADVEISDSLWKPDFDLVDRYQSFANELMRISLLGIAAYGFLITEVCKDNKALLGVLRDVSIYIIISSVFLILSLIAVLAHRFLSTACLFNQVLIMRSLKRLENDHWTDKEKQMEGEFLKTTRALQSWKSKLSHYVLVAAAICFALGFIFLIVVSHEFLQAIPEHLVKADKI